MNYPETLDYLFTRLPMYSRIGAAAYKADLTNTIALCEYLGNPEKKFKSIHIAGTNGKGSVSHSLAAIFQQAGYKTGLYTSPHLKDFRERIRIDGSMIPEQYVIDFTERLQNISLEIEPSFFELTVAMAFEYFANEKVDVAIIETGLGGRLDSTNVINPELSVITNISLDHTNLLGSTIEAIAFEKAGIIKNGVALVIGESNTTTRPVFVEKAAAMGSLLIEASKEFEVMNWHWSSHMLVAEIASTHATDHKIYELDLAGIYQLKNLVTILAAVKQLRIQGWQIDEHAVGTALKTVKKLTGLHGRWEVLQDHPVVILDVAHNVAGMEELVKQIEVTYHDSLHIILGMVNDKDIHSVIRLLPPTATYYFTAANIPRAMDKESLQELALEHELVGKTYPDVNAAIAAATFGAKSNDLIIVCGSVFLVGEVNAI